MSDDDGDDANINEVEVTNWLKSIKLPQYTAAFLANGFDDLEVPLAIAPALHRTPTHAA